VIFWQDLTENSNGYPKLTFFLKKK